MKREEKEEREEILLLLSTISHVQIGRDRVHSIQQKEEMTSQVLMSHRKSAKVAIYPSNEKREEKMHQKNGISFERIISCGSISLSFLGTQKPYQHEKQCKLNVKLTSAQFSFVNIRCEMS